MRTRVVVFILGIVSLSTLSAYAEEIGGADVTASYTFEQITVAATSVGLTAANYAVGQADPPAKKAVVYVETAQIRYRLDGTDPTSTVGEILNPNDRLYLNNYGDILRFRAIRTTSTSATIDVSYRR